MTDNNGNIGDSKSWIPEWFGDVARTLANGVAGDIYLAAAVLIILVIIPPGVIYAFANESDVIMLVVIAVVFIVAVIILLLRATWSQQRHVIEQIGKKHVRMSLSIEGRLPSFDATQTKNIKMILRGATELAAKKLKMDNRQVRANVFFPVANNRLRIHPALAHNMTDGANAEELTISMPIGYGSTGRCFSEKKPNIAIFHEGWGESTIEKWELSKVHKDLRWIISLPLSDRPDSPSPLCVINVDGLGESKSDQELENLVSDLLFYVNLIWMSLAIATNEAG